MSNYEDNFPDFGIYSSYWAYNQPGWKPRCVRCHTRRADCKKFNSSDLGTFAGEWICTDCREGSDYLTPAQTVLEGHHG